MRKKFILIISFVFIILTSIYLHTTTLIVSRHSIKLAHSGKKIKLAHVTDLHTKGLGRLEQQLIRTLEVEKPDIIVITGDLATPSGTLEGYRDVLMKLRAPQGVFFVSGNWEYWEPIPNLENLLNESGIIDLTNQVKKIDNALWLIGFDDGEEGQPELEIIQGIPSQDLKISLFHSPSFFDKVTSNVHLSFAGHSHGGQIRIPLMGSMWVPDGIGEYDQGWFEKGTSKMYVSRGIGTSILPLRINCSPELAIVEIRY